VPTNPVLVVHGGAWAIPDDMVDAHLNGVRNAAAAGWRILERGGSALDAVEEAVVVLEDDETFDAGRGAFLNRDGKVQLDAFIMDGLTLRGGGVGCVERLRNPVRAARKILSDSPHVYFVAEGAERFAAEHGIALCRNEDLIIPREVERLRAYQAQASSSNSKDGNDLFAPTAANDMLSHDTVGAVALDRDGNIGASTSTGGTLNKAPGRLGDSQRSRVHHRMGRAHHEARASKVGSGSRRIRQFARVGSERSDELSAATPQWPRRNYSPRRRRPFRNRPQYSTHGLGDAYHTKTRRRYHAQRVTKKKILSKKQEYPWRAPQWRDYRGNGN
jgi:hypothetical protein